MAWDSKYVNFGVLKIEGNKVYVYYDRQNYVTIYVQNEVRSANWAGGDVNVTLTDGKIRKYRDLQNYISI